MGWNPFRRNVVEESDEEESDECEEEETFFLPDYDSNDDTKRITISIAKYRKSHTEASMELLETAQDVKEEARLTSHTMRSMSAFVVPKEGEG